MRGCVHKRLTGFTFSLLAHLHATHDTLEHIQCRPEAVSRKRCFVRTFLLRSRGQALPTVLAGTGDCCAPKLLAAAAAAGLIPQSLVEFWYGSPPNTATAQASRMCAGFMGSRHACAFGYGG